MTELVKVILIALTCPFVLPLILDKNCRKTNTERFIERVLEVIDDIRHDERKDIRDYAKETAELYGIRFNMTEAEDDRIQDVIKTK